MMERPIPQIGRPGGLPYGRMQIATLIHILEQPHIAAEHLAPWGLSDVEAGRRVLLELADLGLTLDLLSVISRQLATELPQTLDPDAALAGFGRFLAAVRSPLALAALLERDPTAMPALLTALSLGPQWSESLLADPEAFELLREGAEQSPARDSILSDVKEEIVGLDDERAIMTALARIQQRELLRVAYGECRGELSLEQAQERLTALGESVVSAALAAAAMKSQAARQLPAALQEQLRICVLAMGDLGARQCSLRLSFDLLLLYDAPGADAAALEAIHDQMERIAKTIARWLVEARRQQTVRFVQLPDSSLAALAHAADDVVVGFDSFGRTWHRQQMLKARPVAGDHELGRRVLARLEGWLYRRYLNRADETGIRSLKRRILVDATLRQDDWRQPRMARGGIQTIEATAQWLQLLVGGDKPRVRTAGTREALQALAECGTLAAEEASELESNYAYFQQLEHFLQIFTEQGDELPGDDRLIRRLAVTLGNAADAAAFVQDLQQRQDRSWQIIRKLLTSAFAEEAPPAREVELLLDPAPPPHEVRAALAPFGFAQPEEALAALNDLASEQIPFLSTRRCRHLLATILPRLLTAISTTPNPDWALSNVARVSNSLGGKGVLWDLFRFSPATLELYVKLCAASPYLSGILTNNPGMIDELIDSLQLDRLPGREVLAATLDELCRGAADTLPMLHDFKNAEHLRIGVRDILGKEDIDRTHAALADVAETCLTRVIDHELARLVEKYGAPTIGLGPFEGEPCRVVVLGLGKLGGREPNYHSPLDLLVLYEAEGTTRPAGHQRRVERTANNHFFYPTSAADYETAGGVDAEGAAVRRRNASAADRHWRGAGDDAG